MKVTTKRLSICQCGFLFLADNIPLGTEYEIDPNRKANQAIICGGCKRVISYTGVLCEKRGDSEAGFLAEQIFQDPPAEKIPSITCPKCQRTSYNAKDISEGYCGHCHEFTAKRLPIGPCPTCGYKLEAATKISKVDSMPKPGDISLCFKCGEILQFNPDLTIRLAELNDLLQLSPRQSEMIDRAQKMIREKRPADRK